MSLLKKCTAEFIGTFVLVFFACGTAAVVGCSAENGTGYLLTALAFGLVIVAMAYRSHTVCAAGGRSSARFGHEDRSAVSAWLSLLCLLSL